MNLSDRIDKYAELIVTCGCALKEGQELYISAPVQTLDFVRRVTRCAYDHGARYVTINWRDDVCGRMAYDNAPLDVFENVPEWSALRSNSMARNGAAVLTILSDDPLVMKGIDQQKIVSRTIATHEACKEFYDSIDLGKTVWCIAGAASEQWATHVFPQVDADIAVERLWEAILMTARVTDDPAAAWAEHRASFDTRKRWLNEQGFDALRYTASNGTDLTIGLIRGAHWEGGGQEAADGTYFFPNIPTEEVFTSPDRMRADGIVHSALPLIHNGSPVEDFWVRFENGRAVECDARVGHDVLQGIIDTDEGSCRLGECALVPFDSPIRNTGILFYETLYDENASCHLALGKGFPETLEGGYELDKDELLARGINDSATHVDFMIGTEDLHIDGIRADGTTVAIFDAGNWAFEA